MMDIIFLAIFCWCVLLMIRKDFDKALLYAGGVIAAGFVATQISEWVTQRFASPVNALYHWVAVQVTTQPPGIGVLSIFLPPVETMTSANTSIWIATHVVRVLLQVSITIAIFILFVVIAKLSDALWDRESLLPSNLNRIMTVFISLGTATYVIVLSVLFTTSLAWIRQFPLLSKSISQSIVAQTTAKILLLIHHLG